MLPNYLKKTFAAATVLIGLILLSGLWLAFPNPFPQTITYGVTFSAPYAQKLSGDWRATYQAILAELQVKHLRLITFWDQVEPVAGEYDFTDLDYQLDEAARRGAQVILAVGRKLPRWPECHDPTWTKGLSDEAIKARTLLMLATVVNRYRHHPTLSMWQLENEPFLDFGDCPPGHEQNLAQEESLIRSLDPDTPIMLTDSGELNWWLKIASYGDVIGTTMYRTVYSQRANQSFSYDYIFPSWLYRAKARLVKLIYDQDVLVSELQGEPWGPVAFTSMSTTERLASFSPRRFKQLDNFARRTQFKQAYWWGVEYWYWEKETNTNNRYWNYAKTLFQ